MQSYERDAFPLTRTSAPAPQLTQSLNVEMPIARPIWIDPGTIATVGAWHSANGALTRAALNSIIKECNANWGGVGSECGAAARQGAGAFRTVPESARAEFAFLAEDSCPPDRAQSACLDRIELNRVLRSLPRGRLEPKPLQMKEGVRTRFTAFIVDRGHMQGLPGVPTDIGIQRDPASPGVQKQVSLIPISARMCFRLTADDATKVQIDPVSQPDVVVERGRICMDVAEGGGGLKFDPSWDVTPKTGDDLRLYLDTDHIVGSESRNFPHEPRPLIIDVIPKPSLWDRIDAFFKRAKETVDLATGLALAIGAFFAAIAGWAVWSWFRKKPAQIPGS